MAKLRSRIILVLNFVKGSQLEEIGWAVSFPDSIMPKKLVAYALDALTRLVEHNIVLVCIPAESLMPKFV
jgi:hypothetical protein